MIFSKYIKDRGQALSVVDKLATVVVFLVISNLFLTYTSLTNYERFIFMPAKLDKRATLAYDSASKEFHKKYGLSLSSIIGNMTPSTAKNTITMLKHLMTPSLYHSMSEKLAQQASQIKSAGVTLSFIPEKLEYETATGLSFATGLQLITPLQGKPKEKTVTFEYRLQVSEYVPKITHFDFYEGVARTLKYKEKHADIIRKLDAKKQGNKNDT